MKAVIPEAAFLLLVSSVPAWLANQRTAQSLLEPFVERKEGPKDRDECMPCAHRLLS